MESMDTIRKELKEVRYYYANREMFDQAAKDVGENEIIKTVNRYNAAVQKAPAKLYALYIGLYVGNRTQEAIRCMSGRVSIGTATANGFTIAKRLFPYPNNLSRKSKTTPIRVRWTRIMKRNASIFYTVRKTNTIYYHLSPHASTEKKAGVCRKWA